MTSSRRETVRRGVALACAAALPALATAPAIAQDGGAWPSRPVKLIVPYAAGGFADTRARRIAEKIGEALGQPVVVENRAGAGGVTGTNLIAKATDGHTFGFASPAPMVTNAMLMKKLPYDPERDLLPIVLIEQAPLILVTSPTLPYKSVAELIEAAKARPDTLSYGSSGVGGAHHLSGELLAYRTGTRLVHVPYKGGALAATDLIGGHLALMFEMGYSALPAIKGDKIRALAVSSRHRLEVLPDVPTLDEAGVGGFESYNWLGMVAPAGTPAAVVRRLNEVVNAAIRTPEVRRMIEDSGGEVVGGTPEAFGRFLAEERARWAPVIRNANISIE